MTDGIIGDFNSKLFTPEAEGNKYSRGVVAVAISPDFPGAGLMAALSAQAAGAGYVKAFCPSEILTLCQIQYPSLVFRSYNSNEQLGQLLDNEKYEALIIGAGWSEWPLDLTWRINKPTVFDAGFLQSDLLERVPTEDQYNLILTPHSGELSQILNSKSIENFTRQFDGVLLCKGPMTIVHQGSKTHSTDWNSPILATAGTGDVLAGLIGRCLCLDNCEPFQACEQAIDLHRQAAKSLPNSCPPEKLIENIHLILNS